MQRKSIESLKRDGIERSETRSKSGDEFANQKIALLTWLQNVRSAPPAVIEQYSEWLGCQPGKGRAARCGYVARDRFLWGAGPDTSVAELGGSCPPDWQLVPGFKSFLELQYIGKRPLPARVHFQ